MGNPTRVEAQHTPEPWEWDQYGHLYGPPEIPSTEARGGLERRCIATARRHPSDKSRSIMAANMRLMRSAPKLLKALERIDQEARVLESYEGPADDRDMWAAIYAAREVIAEARGEE